MSRDIERAGERVTTVAATIAPPPIAPQACGETTAARDDRPAEPEMPDPTQAPDSDKPASKTARSNMPAPPADPELARYRSRLEEQLAARRDARSATGLMTTVARQTSHRRPIVWIAPIAASAVVAVAAGWWLSPRETTRRVEMAVLPSMRGDELAQLNQALLQERDKVEKLSRDLATAWRELTAQAVTLADKAAQDQELSDLRQALQQTEGLSATYERLLAEERQRNHLLEERLVARREATPATATVTVVATVRPETLVLATSDKPAVAAARPAPASDAEVHRLMARASLLLVQGDIGAARVVLERAAETGSAPALFALAETFDPLVLSTWGTLGTQGDVARARELYTRAFAGGVEEAKDRLAELNR